MLVPSNKRISCKELLENELVKNVIKKYFKFDKQLLTIRKMREWADYPCLKKLGLLYLAT